MVNKENGTVTISQKMQKSGRLGIAYAKERIKEPELSTVQYKVCITIHNSPGLSQDDVSRDLGMDKSTIAKLISKLMSSDVVKREVNPKDHREYKLYLTEKGQQLTDEFVFYMYEWEDSLCSKIGVDHALVHAQLTQLIEAAESINS